MGKEADIPVCKLNSSYSMPALGFGTGGVAADGSLVKNAVLKALEIGYRNFDTAAIYENEKFIGAAFKEAFAKGLVKREELFVTTALSPNMNRPEEILSALKESLSNLQLEYVDLYLPLWPMNMRKESNFTSTNVDDYLPLDVKGTWQAMEKLVELGLAKSIGVSNYYVKILKKLLAHAKIPPAVNLIECNPQWRQEKLRAYCRKNGIQVTGWSPIAGPGEAWGSTSLLENPIMKEIAQRHGKSVPQISLRWVYESGVVPIPKSYTEKRQKENIDIFDFSLTKEDHEKIKAIPQATLCDGDLLPMFKGTPWRNFEEFWDNEE